ncbi:hypothetical protein [Flagellimonas sp.]|uniref:hypothetical protein n=1 Tax=Flagellimonas sp. TaxID=2058762 RepID=UPI003BAA8220
MKKELYFLTLIFILASCSTEKKLITEFETILGAENAEDLALFIQTFEREVLASNYTSGNLSQKYQEFTNNCFIEGAYNALPIQGESLNRFRDTQMWNEIFAQIDSTWIGEYDGLNARVIYNSEIGIQEIGTIGRSTRDISSLDSLRTAALQWQIWNHRGKYMKAFEKIKDKNAFIKEYYEVKTTLGELSSHLFCDMILRHKPDFNNYFIKRIIVIELARIYVN